MISGRTTGVSTIAAANCMNLQLTSVTACFCCQVKILFRFLIKFITSKRTYKAEGYPSFSQCL